MPKPPKIECEICGEKDPATLHHHHIIERTDFESTEHPYNILVCCSNCHNKIHHGNLKVIGIYPSTKRPYGRTAIFEENGKKNFDLDEPYYRPKPKVMRLYERTKDKRDDY